MNVHASRRVIWSLTIVFLACPVWAAQPEPNLRETFDKHADPKWEFLCDKEFVAEDGGRLLRLSGASHAIYPLEATSFSLSFRLRCFEDQGTGDVTLASQFPDYYAVTFGEDEVHISRRTHDQSRPDQLLKSAASQLQPGRWHDVLIEVEPGQIAVSIDASQLVTLENLQPSPSGPFGIGVIQGATKVDYDDVTISRIQPIESASTATDKSDMIKTIEVTLDVGNGGSDLQEPVALDLGLGFPLWLHPLGRKQGEYPPFGAIPQRTTATQLARAGSRVSFTFDSTDDAGLDQLRTATQLFAGVRTSDVCRVGIASSGMDNWELAGFEVVINGQTVTSGQPANAAQQSARAQLGRLQANIAALRRQLADLEGRENLAAEDQQRLAQSRAQLASLLIDENALRVRNKLSPNAQGAQQAAQLRLSQIDDTLAQIDDTFAAPEASAVRVEAQISASRDSEFLLEKQRLMKQLQAEYPWFVDADFQPAQTVGDRVRSAKVILETHAHAGAHTDNLVFFAVPGRKYLMNPAFESLSAEDGPQEFELDLLSGPLFQREFAHVALGVLASPQNATAAPDRWHPRRLLLLIDGEVCYDSEEQPLDRRSLDAIRLIPPTHVGPDGSVVQNSPSSRECFRWVSGKGLGLDAGMSGAADLPEQGEPGYPEPEEGLESEGLGGYRPPETSPEGENEFGFTPESPPFPGETAPGPGWYPPGGSTAPAVPPASPGSPGPGTPPPPNPVAPPPTTTPIATAHAFTVDNVWISSSSFMKNQPFEVKWKMVGDVNEIDSFDVSLRVIRPDQKIWLLSTLVNETNVPTGQRSKLLRIAQPITAPYYYIAPRVVARSKPGSTAPTPNPFIGPARAVFPVDISPHVQQPMAQSPISFTDSGGTETKVPITPTGPPPSGSRGAWYPADTQTPQAIKFGEASPASHLVMKPQSGDEITVRYLVKPYQGEQLLVAHFGFSGTTTGVDQYDADIECTLIPKRTDAQRYRYPTIKVKGVRSNDLLKPLHLIEKVIREADAGVRADQLEIKVTIKNGSWIDPKCCPAIFGMRLVPVVASAAPTTHPINADLALNIPSGSAWVNKQYWWPVPGDLRFRPPGEFSPKVSVINNGPEDIPATILKQTKIRVVYYLGQYGKHWHEIHNPNRRMVIYCTPQLLVDVGPGAAKWPGGSLPVNNTIEIVPMLGSLNPASLANSLSTSVLDNQGRLKTTTRAWKVLMAQVDIVMPGTNLLNDHNLNNNSSGNWEPAPIPIIGNRPLDTEVILFETDQFGGTTAHFEVNPDLQRQRLVWDLGSTVSPPGAVSGPTDARNPSQPNMYGHFSVRSMWVGDRVDVLARKGHHFYQVGNPMPPIIGATPGAKKRLIFEEVKHGIGSLIICPKSNGGPIGVEGICFEESTGLFTKHVRHTMFFPMPEDDNKKLVRFDTLAVDDSIDAFAAWRDTPTLGPGPVLKLIITVGKDANLVNDRKLWPHLSSHMITPASGWTQDYYPFNFTDLKNEISSLHMELK